MKITGQVSAAALPRRAATAQQNADGALRDNRRRKIPAMAADVPAAIPVKSWVAVVNTGSRESRAGNYEKNSGSRGNGAYGTAQGRGYRDERPYSPAGGHSRRNGEKSSAAKARDFYDPYVQRGAPPLPRDKKPRPQPKAYEKPLEMETQQQEADATLLVGRNAVWEALKAGRSMERLYVAQGVDETALQGILGVAYREKVKIERVPRARVAESRRYRQAPRRDRLPFGHGVYAAGQAH